MPTEEKVAAAILQLSDQELEQELTIAVASEHRRERFNELFAERERRRGLGIE